MRTELILSTWTRKPKGNQSVEEGVKVVWYFMYSITDNQTNERLHGTGSGIGVVIPGQSEWMET